MPYFGEVSESRLITCQRPIRVVMRRVIERVDFSVLCGARTLEEQQGHFNADPPRSTLDGIIKISKHQIGLEANRELSAAIDVVPYPVELHGVEAWDDNVRFALFAGEVLATGWELGVELRWGGDWDGDGSAANQNFHDWPHFELVTEVGDEFPW